MGGGGGRSFEYFKDKGESISLEVTKNYFLKQNWWVNHKYKVTCGLEAIHCGELVGLHVRKEYGSFSPGMLQKKYGYVFFEPEVKISLVFSWRMNRSRIMKWAKFIFSDFPWGPTFLLQPTSCPWVFVVTAVCWKDPTVQAPWNAPLSHQILPVLVLFP